MSVKAITWAFDQELPAGEKVVLLVLADNHNDGTGACYPGQETIARKASMSIRGVRNNLKKLVERKLIKVEPRMQSEGRGRTSDSYTLQLDQPATSAEWSEDQPATSDMTNRQDRAIPLYKENRKREPEEDVPVTKEMEIFEYYAERVKTKTRWTGKKRQLIQARLRDGYTVEDLKKAIDFVTGSTWHRERGHVQLDLILRNGEQVEKYMAMTNGGKTHDDYGRERPDYDAAVAAKQAAAGANGQAVLDPALHLP